MILRSNNTIAISCTKSTCTSSNLLKLWNTNRSNFFSIKFLDIAEYNSFDISKEK